MAPIVKFLLAPPHSQLTHVGVSFTRLHQISSKEIYRGLFLDKTQLATSCSVYLSPSFSLSLCAKYFSLKNVWTLVGIQNVPLMHYWQGSITLLMTPGRNKCKLSLFSKFTLKHCLRFVNYWQAHRCCLMFIVLSWVFKIFLAQWLRTPCLNHQQPEPLIIWQCAV